jgi:hypothetical protein
MRDRHIESLSGLSFQLAIHYPLSSTPRLVHILPLHLQDIFPPTLLEEGPHTTILLDVHEFHFLERRLLKYRRSITRHQLRQLFMSEPLSYT